MSKNLFEKIKCPKCGNTENFRIWESVNTDINPEMAHKVKDRSLFKFVCPKCKADYEIEYTTLYHNPKLRFMVYYLSKESPETEKTIKENHLFSTDVLKDYKLRIVYNKSQFIEKINILEDGLNDIIIEVLKGLCLMNLPAERKDFFKAIYYYGKDNNQLSFLVLYNNNLPSDYARIAIKEYDGLIKDLVIKQPSHFEVVDVNNISNFIIKDNRTKKESSQDNFNESQTSIKNEHDEETDHEYDNEKDEEVYDRTNDKKDNELITKNNGEKKIMALINSYYKDFLSIARKSDIITNAEFEIFPFLCSIIDLTIEQANIRTTIIREKIYPNIMDEQKWKENQKDEFMNRIRLYDEMIMGKNPRAIWLNGNSNLNMKQEKTKCLVAFGDILYNPECAKDYYNAPIRLYGVFESINFTNQVMLPMVELLNNYSTDILNFIDAQDE